MNRVAAIVVLTLGTLVFATAGMGVLFALYEREPFPFPHLVFQLLVGVGMWRSLTVLRRDRLERRVFRQLV